MSQRYLLPPHIFEALLEISEIFLLANPMEVENILVILLTEAHYQSHLSVQQGPKYWTQMISLEKYIYHVSLN